jgi:hypothetical protein
MLTVPDTKQLLKLNPRSSDFHQHHISQEEGTRPLVLNLGWSLEVYEKKRSLED